MSFERLGPGAVPANITGVNTVRMNPQAIDPIYEEAKFFYNESKGTFTIYTNYLNSSLEVGKENWVDAKNNTGVDILNGAVVYISGADSDFPEITLARSDKISTSTIIGMATDKIVAGAVGPVTAFGIVRSVDTSTCLAGDPLFLSDSVAGEWTKTKPSGLSSIVRIGAVVVSDALEGTILIMPVVGVRAEPPRAEMYVTNNAGQTTINNVGDWEPVIQLTQPGQLLGFTHNGAGALTADNTVEEIAGIYQVVGSISSGAVSANKTYEYAVGINGGVQTKTITSRRYSSADTGAQPISGQVVISGGDVITLQVRNITDDTNIVVQNCNIAILKLGE